MKRCSRRRKELHFVVARAIDERFPVIKQVHPEVLARHWTEAGETDSAIAEWSRAGEQAESRNAFKEALDSYRRAPTVVRIPPETPPRSSPEVGLKQSITSGL